MLWALGVGQPHLAHSKPLPHLKSNIDHPIENQTSINPIENRQSTIDNRLIQKALLSQSFLNEQLINPKFMKTFLKVPYEKSKAV